MRKVNITWGDDGPLTHFLKLNGKIIAEIEPFRLPGDTKCQFVVRTQGGGLGVRFNSIEEAKKAAKDHFRL